MTFVNLSLLAGSALIAVPIVLHLIMRRRPVLLEFPTLRFLQSRRDTNQRRLRLRHLLLLLLRAGAIALLALALSRPSVRWAGAAGGREAPVAAVLLFDTAARMQYRHENQTRLEAAQKLGLWLLDQLPDQSEVGVLDARVGSTAAFQSDRDTARRRIERLDAAANAQPMSAAIDQAVELLRQSQLARKELYLFTDLSQAAWPIESAPRLQRVLSELGDLGVYVIDVGVRRPVDVALGELRLSGEAISQRGALAVQTELACLGEGGPRVVELHLLGADRRPQQRGRQSVEAAPGQLQPVEFRVGGLPPGVHQGFVRLVGQDALAADDVRFFTVMVQPPRRVLVAAPRPAESYALFLTEALAPEMYRKRGQARFDCDICNLAELERRDLSPYAAVWLLDPTPLEPAVWKKLADFAAEGRGVAVALGRNAAPIDSFNAAPAQELLAGKLLRQARRPDGDLYLVPSQFHHPMVSAFRELAGAAPWDAFPVFRYWELDQPANVVIPYSDVRPALLERPVGQGRALTLTTPVSDSPQENPWNLLPVGEAWPFLILVNQMTDYLVGGGDPQLNYLAGQTVALPLDAEAAARRSYLLFTPGGLSFPVAVEPQRRRLVVSATEQVGNYRLRSGGTQDGQEFGFSVNYGPDQTRLDRLDDRELSNLFGPVHFRLARTQDQIDRDIRAGWIGHELDPPLIMIVAMILALELLVSNRFYKV